MFERVKNNFTAQIYARADPNTGDLVQRELGWSGWSHEHKNCNICETVQDRTKVTMTD